MAEQPADGDRAQDRGLLSEDTDEPDLVTLRREEYDEIMAFVSSVVDGGRSAGDTLEHALVQREKRLPRSIR